MTFTTSTHTEPIDLIFKSSYGMKITIIFTDESKKRQEQFNNVEAFHWLSKMGNKRVEHSIIINSVIHHNTLRIPMDNIEFVILEVETTRYNHFSYIL